MNSITYMLCGYRFLKIHWSNFFLVPVMMLSFTGIDAQDFYSNKLDSFFNAMAVANTAMGSIAISKNGELLNSNTIGYKLMNKHEMDTVTKATKYRVGSITKMFTAVIIFQLLEENKLSLQTTLDNYLPDIPNARLMTIEHLLRHQTGLHHIRWKRFARTSKTQEALLAIIAKGKAKFLPGLKFDYNNINYLLLGYVIEKICGKPYETILNEKIISKIGLVDTYYGHQVSIENNEAYSYRFKKSWEKRPIADISISGASGALVSTPIALARFMDALFSGKLISNASLDQMKSIRDGYGMGLMQFPYHSKNALGHIGSINGFVSVAAYLPEDSLSIVYCSNGERYPVQDIVMTALDIYFHKAPFISEIKFDVVKKKRLRRYTGMYSNLQIPMKILIHKKQHSLMLEGIGYTPLPLESIGRNKFRLVAAGLEIEFDNHRRGLNAFMGNINYYFSRR